MKKLMIGLVTVAFVGVFSPAAEAGLLTIRISSTTCSVTNPCPTNPLTITANPLTPDVVSFTGTFGDVSLQINALSNNPGTSLVAFSQQQDITVNNLGGAAEQITIEITQTDFTDPTGVPAVLGSSLSATGLSSAGTSMIDLTSGYDATNAPFVYTVPPTVLHCNMTGIPAPFCGGNSSTTLTPSALYSLSNELVINLAAGTSALNVTATTTLTAVPDGGMTMSLLGMAMGGLGLMARRRK